MDKPKLNYCWNCAGLIPLSTGKRKRRYCNDACRMAYKRKTEQAKSEQVKTEQGMTQAVGATGGEYSFKTIKGKIQDVHRTLPACVPEPVRSRYARGEPEYTQTIDRLLAHNLDQLKDMKVWIPVWRYTAGQAIA